MLESKDKVFCFLFDFRFNYFILKILVIKGVTLGKKKEKSRLWVRKLLIEEMGEEEFDKLSEEQKQKKVEEKLSKLKEEGKQGRKEMKELNKSFKGKIPKSSCKY